MNNYSLIFNIFLTLIVLIYLILFIINFSSLFMIKWRCDLIDSNNLLCNQKKISKLELESYRYNICRYLYNIDDNSFNDNQIIFYNSYYGVMTITSIFLLSYFYFIIFKLFKFNDINSFNNQYPFLIITISIVLFYYIYYIIFGINIIKERDYLNNYILSQDNTLYKYYSLYKIINAIIDISDLKNDILEFSNPNIENIVTLDKFIENNIASYYNIYNSYEIKNIKTISYNDLDFLKYITLDSLSVFYFKNYFDNIYIKLPDTNNQIYLDKLYNNKNKNKTDTINNELYDNINFLIHKKINNHNKDLNIKINIPNDDYIKYILDNKNIILNDKNNTFFSILQNKLKYYTNFIYNYLIYFILIFFIFSHYLFISINDTTYIIFLFILISIYTGLAFIYHKYNNY